MPNRSITIAAAFILILAFVGIGTHYAFTVPAYEAPDEVAHFEYALRLRSGQGLPLQQVGMLGEAHQPPLYYALVALVLVPVDVQNRTGQFYANPDFMWAGQGGDDPNVARHGTAETFPYEGHALALRVARLVSVVLGAITISIIVAFGWTLFPQEPLIGLLAGGVVAFNPQFLFMSAAVNNGNLLITATGLTALQLLYTVRKPTARRWWLVGLWVAIAILAKVSGIVALALALLGLLLISLRYRSMALLVKGGLGIVGAVLVVVGWWFARNQSLYGDPFGWAVYQEIFAVNLRNVPLTGADVAEFFRTQFRSFWGVFGWMNVESPDWFYQAVRWGSGLSIAAVVVGLVAGGRRLTRFQWVGIALAGALVVIVEVYMLSAITTCNASCYQGRYLFPAYLGIATLVSVGWLTMLGWMPTAAKTALLVGMLGSMAYVAVWMVDHVIVEAYDVAALSKTDVARLPATSPYTFTNDLELRSYDLEYQPAKNKVDLDLYWQVVATPASDYVVVTRVTTRDGAMVVEEEGIAGDRDYPPTLWLPADVVEDEHGIDLPDSLPAGTYQVQVYVLDPTTRTPYPLSDNQPFLTLPVTFTKEG